MMSLDSGQAGVGARVAAGSGVREDGAGRNRLTHSGLAVALTLGAMAGAVDVVHAGLRRTVLGQLVFVPEYFWWTAPLLNAVLVAIGTLLIVGLLGRVRPQWREAGKYAVPTSLAVLSVLLHAPRLHPLAVLLLAVGAGVRAGVWLSHRARRVDRYAMAGLPLFLLAVPLAAVLFFGLPSLAPAAAAPRAALPNVIIIILDTVRAIELSLYGASQPTTPVMDGLGREGVVFDRASSTAPWTLPSHAGVFTGLWPHEISAGLRRPLESRPATLAEALGELGYATAGFSANVEYASRETGVARGFHHWEDHRWSLRGVLRLTELSRFLFDVLPQERWDQPGRVDGALINRRFSRWLDDNGDRPFFAFLNYYDAHAPYYPPPEQWRRFVGDIPRRPLNNPHEDADDAAEVALMRKAYAGALNYIDGQIGLLTADLRARGQLDNTILVITADHGEEFAEHGILGHGNTLFRPSVHVPLIVRWPAGLAAGQRVAQPVSIRDIPATIMELIGGRAFFPGRSLRTTWTNDGAAPAAVLTYTERAINQPAHLPASRGPLAGVEIPGYRLIVETAPFAVSLFDQVTDSEESTNLAMSSAHRPILRAMLDSLRTARVPIPVD